MAVWSVTSAPASEPISLSEAKNYLKIPAAFTDDDDFITSLIVMAREYVERTTSRALITQTITEYFDAFPSGNGFDARVLKLHISPLVSITDATGLSYIASGGDPSSYTAWDNTSNAKYFLDIISGSKGIGPARICKKTDVDWPSIEPYTNAVKVVYVAGYGASGSAVPGPLMLAIYRLIGLWYYGSLTDKDFDSVTDLLNPFKVHK